MIVKCAWCGCQMGSKKGSGVSHGICRNCQVEILTDYVCKMKTIQQEENKNGNRE